MRNIYDNFNGNDDNDDIITENFIRNMNPESFYILWRQLFVNVYDNNFSQSLIYLGVLYLAKPHIFQPIFHFANENNEY